jgi:hypothetical protein
MNAPISFQVLNSMTNQLKLKANPSFYAGERL